MTPQEMTTLTLRVSELKRENQELQSQNARLREALKPFAELGFPYAVEAMEENFTRS